MILTRLIGMSITPKIQKISYKDEAFGDSDIVILDDCFTHNEINLIYTMCFYNRPYMIANRSHTDIQHLSHERLISELSDQDIQMSGIFTGQRRKIIDEYVSMDSNIQSAYINLGVKTDDYKIHIDFMGRNSNLIPKTILYYANMEWQTNWGGQTLLFDSSGTEIIHSITVKPGRLAIFDSRIPHTATTCAPAGPPYRFTLAFKLIGKAS
jgi:hypothetical protein